MTGIQVEATAPGRLDVMGGIADYSGSLVLQLPIRQQVRINLSLRSDFRCSISSRISSGEVLSTTVDYRSFLKNGEVDYGFAGNQFKQNPGNTWIAYILGCALVLQKEKGIDFRGADIEIQSDVPLGKGVASSAAIEVAVMKALAKAFNIRFKGTELPTLAQRVENHIVGAPCGLMDQLVSFFGEPDTLLPIICQPDQVQALIELPDEVFFVGIDSGIRHSVAGTSYGDVRCAAFMGYSIIARQCGVTTDELIHAKCNRDLSDLPYKGYLCNISVKEFESKFKGLIPESIRGKEFLNRFGDTIDHVTSVDPNVIYSVKVCTSHPVYENDRVHRFREFIAQLNEGMNKPERLNLIQKMGELMYQSHESYSRCGLGSTRTDEMVSIARQTKGIFGAKITGGGNGGTVCLLAAGDEGLESAKRLHQLFCLRYNERLNLFI